MTARRTLTRLRDLDDVQGAPGTGQAPVWDAALQKAVWGDVATQAELDAVGAAAPVLTPATSLRNVIQPTGAAINPLRIRGFASQSASLQLWETSGGVALAAVDSDGAIRGNANNALGSLRLGPLPGFADYGGLWVGQAVPDTNNYSFLGIASEGGIPKIFFNAPGASGVAIFRTNNATIMTMRSGKIQVAPTDADFGINARLTVATELASVIGLSIHGFTGQTADLQQWHSTAGVAKFAADGLLHAPGSLVVLGGGSGGYFGYRSYFDAGAASTIPIVVRGAAAQSADLQQWQDSAGVVGMAIDASRSLKWFAANEQATVGAAGGASALPATPTKYLKVKDSSGATLVVPAYAAA